MSSSENMTNLVGACTEARELSRRRVVPLTPITPVTPIMPTTPMLVAHLFAEGNVMEDLQLAAELGKTLLERNRELEGHIKQLQTTNDDQTQEIEYLSKQTAALREVNDSRLRIYEQLEISIQDLEKNNQRLTAENQSDKRKFKSLSNTIEQLESKNDDLQKSLEDTKLAHLQEEQRGRALIKKPHLIEETTCYRRSISCENSLQVSEDLLNEFSDLKLKHENCQQKLRLLQFAKFEEDKRKEDLEIELSCVSQENTVLLEQLAILKEKQTNVRCFEDELASLDDTTSSKLCRKCMGLTDDTASNLTMQDNDEIEDFEFDNLPGDYSVMKFKNGGYACGSQESLASLNQALSYGGSAEVSPKCEVEAPGNSLLSELDTQYRILIDKYEALLESRDQAKTSQETAIFNSGVDEISGPMSLMVTDISRKTNVSMRCQRCTTCTCDLKPTEPRPKSNMEEYSEVETSSSGFSEGESRFACKCTQTDPNREEMSIYGDDAVTPIALLPPKCLDLTSPLNPCEKRFQNTPQYKFLFKEIFESLKKTVNEKEASNAFTRSLMRSPLLVVMSQEDISGQNCCQNENVEEIRSNLRDENEENRNPNKMITKEKVRSKKGSNYDELMVNKLDLKPIRPDSLDLNNGGTETERSLSCRSRRRKRRQRLNSQQSDTVTSESRNVSSNVDSSKILSESSKNETQAIREPSLATSITNDEVPTPRARCKHKQRNKKNRQIVNKHLENVIEKQEQRSSVLLPTVNSKKLAFSHPSVEVAKLRRLEMTYAEVLKKRRTRDRRC